jgi:hypothetical protein
MENAQARLLQNANKEWGLKGTLMFNCYSITKAHDGIYDKNIKATFFPNKSKAEVMKISDECVNYLKDHLPPRKLKNASRSRDQKVHEKRLQLKAQLEEVGEPMPLELEKEICDHCFHNYYADHVFPRFKNPPLACAFCEVPWGKTYLESIAIHTHRFESKYKEEGLPVPLNMLPVNGECPCRHTKGYCGFSKDPYHDKTVPLIECPWCECKEGECVNPWKEVNGNILDAKETYILHQANCESGHAAGLAKALFEKFPFANFYKDRKDPEHTTPGEIVVRGNVIALLAQRNRGLPSVPNDTTEMRVEWFKKCLIKMACQLKEGDTLAVPCRIGCGLAGGDWEGTYLPLIKDFFERNVLYKKGKLCIYNY